jgi:hypothetical protein
METVVVNGMYVDVNHPIMGIIPNEMLKELYPNNGEWGSLWMHMHAKEYVKNMNFNFYL